MKGNRRVHCKHGKAVAAGSGQQHKEASRSGTGKRLCGKVIYLDIKDQRQAQAIQLKLRKLDAILETFLSKDVDYVISSNASSAKSISQPWSPAESISPLSPALTSPFTPTAGAAPSPTYVNPEGRLVALSRGQALAQMARARARSPSPNSVVASAGKLGIKVIPVEAASRWLDKEMSKQGLTVTEHSSRHQGSSAGKQKSAAKCKRLQEAFIKVESVTRLYRPQYKELGMWPHINLDTPNASCPFDGKGVAVIKHSPCAEKDGPASAVGHFLSRDTQSVNPRRSVEGDGSSRLVGVPILTAGDLRRQQEKRRQDARRRGYCECCAVKYEDIDQHLQEQVHKDFARDKANYQDLDQLMTGLPSTSHFLHNILLRHCTMQVAAKPNATALSNQTDSEPTSDQVMMLPMSSPSKDQRPHASVARTHALLEGAGFMTPTRPPLSPLPRSPSRGRQDDTDPELNEGKVKVSDVTTSATPLQAIVVRRPGVRGVYGSPRDKWRHGRDLTHTPKKTPSGERSMVFGNTPIASLRAVSQDQGSVVLDMESRQAEFEKGGMLAGVQSSQEQREPRERGRKRQRQVVADTSVSLISPVSVSHASAMDLGQAADGEETSSGQCHAADRETASSGQHHTADRKTTSSGQRQALSPPRLDERGHGEKVADRPSHGRKRRKMAVSDKDSAALSGDCALTKSSCAPTVTSDDGTTGGHAHEASSSLLCAKNPHVRTKSRDRSLRQGSTSGKVLLASEERRDGNIDRGKSSLSTVVTLQPDGVNEETKPLSQPVTPADQCNASAGKKTPSQHKHLDSHQPPVSHTSSHLPEHSMRQDSCQDLSGAALEPVQHCPTEPQSHGAVLCAVVEPPTPLSPRRNHSQISLTSRPQTPQRSSPRVARRLHSQTPQEQTPQKSRTDVLKEEEEACSSPVYLRETVHSTPLIVPVRKLRSSAESAIPIAQLFDNPSPVKRVRRSLLPADPNHDPVASSVTDKSARHGVDGEKGGALKRQQCDGGEQQTEVRSSLQESQREKKDTEVHSRSTRLCSSDKGQSGGPSTAKQGDKGMEGCKAGGTTGGIRLKLVRCSPGPKNVRCSPGPKIKNLAKCSPAPKTKNVMPGSTTPSTKKVKLSRSWQLLSDNSMSRLLHSETEASSFDGFHGNEALPSDLTYEYASEVEVTDDEEREWLIDGAQPSDAMEQGEEGSLRDFIPTFSSPGKRSDSSWDDACEWYLSQSVQQQLQNQQVRRRSPRKVPAVAYRKKRRQPCDSDRQQGGSDDRQPRKKRRVKGDSSEGVAQQGARSPMKRLDRTSRHGSGSTKEEDVVQVDEQVLFNYASPHKQGLVPVGPLTVWNGRGCQGLGFNSQRSPGRHQAHAAVLPQPLPAFKFH